MLVWCSVTQLLCFTFLSYYSVTQVQVDNPYHDKFHWIKAFVLYIILYLLLLKQPIPVNCLLAFTTIRKYSFTRFRNGWNILNSHENETFVDLMLSLYLFGNL